jgi:hypothetical protein
MFDEDTQEKCVSEYSAEEGNADCLFALINMIVFSTWNHSADWGWVT